MRKSSWIILGVLVLAVGALVAQPTLPVVGRSQTVFTSLTTTAATIDVFGFGFTPPSGQLAFTDVTTGTPITAPVTLDTAISQTFLSNQPLIKLALGSDPYWTELGDLNGDGKLDLVTSLRGTDSVSVQLGNGDGTFGPATTMLIATGFGTAEAHLASLRGNGTLDLIVGSFNLNEIAVLLGNGTGTFESPVFYTVGSATNTTNSLTVGDFNHDGNLDVAVANAGDNTVSILIGNGTGALTLSGLPVQVGRNPVSIVADDFNGDGYSDLAVANYADGTVTTLLNNQNGAFTATTHSVGSASDSGPRALAITGSVTNLLLGVANFNDNTVSVLEGVGNGAFGPQTLVPVGKGPDALNFNDFNGDGIPDLVVANYSDGTINVLLGSSQGTYSLLGPFGTGGTPQSVAVGDLDGDGTPDVVAALGSTNATQAFLNGMQISVPYSGLSLTIGHEVVAAYTPDAASKYGPSTSPTEIVGGGLTVPPLLSVTKSHSGTFTQGQTGEWDITVSNIIANGATIGTTNVSDTLPTGFTLNGFSGTGWTCGSVTSVVSCTSTQSVVGASAFPTLRLIANVPTSSPTSVSNTASTWGGGDPIHTSPATAAVSNTDTVTVVQVPASINVTSGSGQSANVNTAFANPLVVTVRDAASVPVPNATVIFASPPTGPSVTFAGGINSAATNSSGVATSAVITANGIAGGPYNVVAKVSGLTTNFSLRNVATQATISNVTSTAANGSYTIGATIPLLISFSKAVTVTGVPLLALNSGGTGAYSSGSGTATLTFTYTVAAGQNSPALDATSTSALTLNGGTITDSSSTPAILTLPAPGAAGSLSANKSIVIDTTAPTVVSYLVDWGTQSFNMVTSTRNRLPWEITGITVVFSKPIATASTSSLGGVSPLALTGLGTNTLTWTISPLAQGNFATHLAGNGPNAIKDAAGNPLAGGSGFSQALKVLWGDFNDDGVVNAADLAQVNNARSAPYIIFADMNGDGVVNTTDVMIVRSRIGTSLP